jgi:hypothetical protein
MREFAGARFGVSREELGKWNEEGFTAKFAKLDRWWIRGSRMGKSCQDRPHESSLANLANLAVQILLGLGCGVVRELLIVERW